MGHFLGQVAGDRTDMLEQFLACLFYFQGQYDSPDDFARLNTEIETWEKGGCDPHHRMFYLAVPPSIFGPAANSIQQSAMATSPAWVSSQTIRQLRVVYGPALTECL